MYKLRFCDCMYPNECIIISYSKIEVQKNWKKVQKRKNTMLSGLVRTGPYRTRTVPVPYRYGDENPVPVFGRAGTGTVRTPFFWWNWKYSAPQAHNIPAWTPLHPTSTTPQQPWKTGRAGTALPRITFAALAQDPVVIFCVLSMVSTRKIWHLDPAVTWTRVSYFVIWTAEASFPRPTGSNCVGTRFRHCARKTKPTPWVELQVWSSTHGLGFNTEFVWVLTGDQNNYHKLKSTLGDIIDHWGEYNGYGKAGFLVLLSSLFFKSDSKSNI